MKLTQNEVNLLADTLNGCGTSIAFDEHYIPRMRGNERGALPDGTPTVSGLEAEVYDAIRLNQADRHWEVDGKALLAKLRALSPDDREAIVRAIGRAWDDCNGPGWDKELKALVAKDWNEHQPARN